MSDLQPTNERTLEKLKDTGLMLGDSEHDIRERKVLDADGAQIGHVSALFVDREERKVRMLEVRSGGFLGIGDRHFLLPVDAVTSVAKDAVYVSETAERIAHAPVYDPALVDAPSQQYWEPFYGYYGLSPYWGAGYLYPTIFSPPLEHPSSNEPAPEEHDV